MRLATSFWCAGPAAALGIAPAPSPSAVPLAEGADAAHVRLAHARNALAQGDVRLALSCFDEAAHLRPDLPIAHLGRAMCLTEMGEQAEASEALLDALALPDATGEVTMHLARILALEGAHADAMDLLAQAFALDDSLVAGAVADPAFRTLGDHPRFLQMVGRL